ncbi:MULTISPECIES: FGGY-family carbohydrate kinase [unclassified Agrobacterium]|uniref:FGGY-family carbohydrate kinase n=1 Tax=unclassified Agrobacterium TaxID=2632611 RepID=UPI00244D6334|nr:MULTISPECIES: FGGY-family carbohydrate kinase [unclassified Agrobacterium]MDH0612452.1 FGGY-family carbohydrate kinase [Agrobacterium sp. GD03872]MDH0696349.1 FGGY-family carbohydrate kinase [Agrobacterium sp. GD03871]MDH1059251.1 FGGY-family carbohydrate kinase [Agrobacterium sp. GD03992]MDH2210612.1 FGGY-family carbohydrate kinase [Agrobacterium sp. GD03643]MDH2218118.1 FGGY-family carbohydrate kinase [Agrobacterium sp. GD03638]
MSESIRAGRVAVIDIGKTNAKVVVIDTGSGEEIVGEKQANPVLRDGIYPHYDVEMLWRFILSALQRFGQKPGFDAISITTHGASAALLDGNGDLAMPVLDYEHGYPAAIEEAYRGIRPDFAETGSPQLPVGLNLGAQIHFQKTAFPDDFSRVRSIVTYAQYWAGRLTGILATETTSLGCHTDLWNPRRKSFSSLVARLGIEHLMAPVRSAFDVLGTIRPSLALETGLSPHMPVYCGIHDSNASLLPHLLRRDGDFSVVSTGTWVVNFAIGGAAGALDPTRDTLLNVDAFGRPVPSSRFMGGREYEMLTQQFGHAPEEAIEASLKSVTAKGMMLLPSIVSGSGPFSDKTACWIGDDNATVAERHAAAALYLALMTEFSLSLIGRKGPVLVEGPFASNALYLKALAGFADTEVIAVSGSTGTSAGAALLTGTRPPGGRERHFAPGVIDGLGSYRKAWKAKLV